MTKFKSLLRSSGMKRLLLLLIILIAALTLTSRYLLTFLKKDMDWEWYDLGGVQVTRTTDTHQLLFRKVYPVEQAVLFTSLTLDNKYDLFTIFKHDCDPQKSYSATVTDKNGQTAFPLTCYQNELSFRQVQRIPHASTTTFEKRTIVFTPSNWDLGFLKKDQFIQKNKHFFCTKKHFQACEYEWSRD